MQQSNDDATNLSDSIFSLAEVGYTATPFSLPEGHYRVWFRANNGDVDSKHAVGVSIDQKLTDKVMLFGRYGTQKSARRPRSLLERRHLVQQRLRLQPPRHLGHRLR